MGGGMKHRVVMGDSGESRGQHTALNVVTAKGE